MDNEKDPKTSGKRSQATDLTVSAVLFALSVASLSARALGRVWVGTQRDPWVLPYEGTLPLVFALSMAGLGLLVAILYALRGPIFLKGEAFVVSGLVFLCGACAGVVSATVCQAWLHVAKLAIVGGWYHPRALVAASLVCLALGLIVLGLGACTRSRTNADSV
ncbi:MAG: hypothetical protein IT209_12195 [Armatimonadetes bacterium]|nr:hypothetical protein [Armatimonadota bacterium]